MKKVIILAAKLFIVFIITNASLFAQTKIDDSEVAQLKTEFQKNISIGKDQITKPVKDGYAVELIGSDNRMVIDLNGNIHQPLVAKNVNLLFKVTRQSDNAAAEIPVTNLKIAGKYDNSGVGAKPFVIPSLREWYGEKGSFRLGNKARIVIADGKNTELTETAKLLQEDLQKQIGRKLEIVEKKKPSRGDIFISQPADALLGAEGYSMNIEDAVQISAPAYSGKIFATRTLLQLLRQSADGLSIPKGQIRDYPTYSERGFLLDVGRKFFTIDFLNDYVELLSYYKISNFQIHLSDNAFHKFFNYDWDKTPSGFRLENDTYPNLASKDGFYTKKEFKDLQQKAFRYGIRIIPEIDVPAHALAIVKAIPEIGSEKYGKDHLDLSNPKTLEVVKNIFDEYTKGADPVFIGKEVHIGTDEYAKKEAETFRKFMDDLIKHIQGNGKDVRAWGSLTHAKGETPVTSTNVVLNAWYNGYADPLEMKKLGYKQISTPDGWLYIVPAAGYYNDYLNTNAIYSRWEPRNVGEITFEKGDPMIIGGMFAVWNDIAGNGISEKDVHNRVFPALQVLSEKMWTAQDDNPSLFAFNDQKKTVGESPGLNLRGYFGETPKLLLNLPFDGNTESKSDLGNKVIANDARYSEGFFDKSIDAKDSPITLNLPLEEIGNSYTISFWIHPENASGSVIFTSKNASFQIDSSGIGFQRDAYSYKMTDAFPLGKWSYVTITGNKEATALYINGTLIKNMKDEEITMPYNDPQGKPISYKKVQTLTFPLRKIQIKEVKLDEFKVYNKEMLKDEVLNEYSLYLQHATNN